MSSTTHQSTAQAPSLSSSSSFSGDSENGDCGDNDGEEEHMHRTSAKAFPEHVVNQQFHQNGEMNAHVESSPNGSKNSRPRKHREKPKTLLTAWPTGRHEESSAVQRDGVNVKKASMGSQREETAPQLRDALVEFADKAAASGSTCDPSVPACTTLTQPCTSTLRHNDERRESTSVVSDSRTDNFLLEAAVAAEEEGEEVEEDAMSPSHSPSLRSPTPLDLTAPPKQRRAAHASQSADSIGASHLHHHSTNYSVRGSAATTATARVCSTDDSTLLHRQQREEVETKHGRSGVSTSPSCAPLDEKDRDGNSGPWRTAEDSAPRNARRLSFSGSAEERSRSQSDRFRAATTDPPSEYEPLPSMDTSAPIVCPIVRAMATPPPPPPSESSTPASTAAPAAAGVEHVFTAARPSTPPLPSFVHPDDAAEAFARLQGGVLTAQEHCVKHRPGSPVICPSSCVTNVVVDHGSHIARTVTATPCSSLSATPPPPQPTPPQENTSMAHAAVAAAAAGTATTTSAATPDETRERGEEREVVEAISGTQSRTHSPSPRRVAAPFLVDHDGFVVPSTPSSGVKSNVYAGADKPEQHGHLYQSSHSPVWATPRALMRSTRSYSLDGKRSPLHDSVAGSRAKELDEEDEDAKELSAVSPPRALLPPSHHQQHFSSASPTYHPGSNEESDRSVHRGCATYAHTPLPPPLFSTAPPFATPPLPALSPSFNTVEGLCVPQLVPTHDSVFFPLGTAVIAPVMLHYATVGGWRTCAGGRDYFNHRRLRGGEVAGHTVRWLHTATPRDRFVFLVTPVVNKDEENKNDEEEKEQAKWKEEAAASAPPPSAIEGDVASVPTNAEASLKTSIPAPSRRKKTAQWWENLQTVVFGEAPWFTTLRTACGPRSRIACDDTDTATAATTATMDALQEADADSRDFAAARSSSCGAYKPFTYAFPLTASVSRECFTSDGDANGSVSRSVYDDNCSEGCAACAAATASAGGCSVHDISASPLRRVTVSVETSYLSSHPYSRSVHENSNNNNRNVSYNSSVHYNASSSGRCEGDLRGSTSSHYNYSSNHRAALPCCMSPMLVTRQPSHSSTSVHATPVGPAAQVEGASPHPTPLSLGLALPAAVTTLNSTPNLATPAAANGPLFPLHATGSTSATTPIARYKERGGGGGDAYGGSGDAHNNSYSHTNYNPGNSSSNGGAAAGAMAGLGSQPRDVHRRASVSGHRFVFSPLTGTAVATSGVSPVTPHHPKFRTQRSQQRQPSHFGGSATRSPTQSRPPAAAESRTTHNNNSKSNNSAATPPPREAVLGVEVIEIAHADITAMDYAPRLTSHRLSIEAKEVCTYFFPTLVDALAYYQCSEALPLMEEQWVAGMSSQIPRPQRETPARQKQQQQQPSQQQQKREGRRVSVEHRSGSVRTPSLTAQPAPSLAQDNGGGAPPSVWPRSATWTPDNASPLVHAAAQRRRGHQPPDPQQLQADRQISVTRCSSCPAPPLSLASALRSAGRGSGTEEDIDGGGEDHHVNKYHHTETKNKFSCSDGVAPTRLFRPSSLPSLKMDEDRHQSQNQHLTSPLTASPAAAAAAAAELNEEPRRQNADLSMTPPPASATRRLSDLQRRAPLEAPPASDSMPHLAPPTPAFAAALYPNVAHATPRLVQPRLTSTHHEIVVSVYTADPVFNSVLRELLMPEPGTHPYTVSVAEQKRLLSMVEVGMPAWAIFYSSTGLPYRRLFRLLYSGLTNLWPLLSLAVGVYDLYKHLPQLKRFMERTLDPFTRWLERRFTLRFSVLATYLFSSIVTIFSSLSAFVSQFYVVQLFSLPIVQLVFALVKLPFVLAFDTVWLATSTAFTTVSLVLQLVRVLVMAPVVFVVNIASLRETVGVVAPVAVQGTSLSVKWWKAWSEFWETVASPMKNAVRAWWDSMIHVSTSAAKRETSIRRWYTPKLEAYSTTLGEVEDMIAINAQLWWADFVQPGLRRTAVLVVALVYLYWLFLGISDKVWDDFIYASGVRHPTLATLDEMTGSGSASPVGSGGGGAADTHLIDILQQHGTRTALGAKQMRTAGEVQTSTSDDVTPVAAVLHVLFQAPFDLFESAKNAIIASSSAVTTTITTSSAAAAATTKSGQNFGAVGRLESGVSPFTEHQARFDRKDTAPTPRAVLYTPTSVIQMCDSSGTSTITKTTTQTTAAALGDARHNTTTTTATTTLITTITTTTTVIPLPQASLSALAAELLLPNAVLELLHHLRQLVEGGWTAARGVAAAAAAAQRQKRQQQQLLEQQCFLNGSVTGDACYTNTSGFCGIGSSGRSDNDSDLSQSVCLDLRANANETNRTNDATTVVARDKARADGDENTHERHERSDERAVVVAAAETGYVSLRNVSLADRQGHNNTTTISTRARRDVDARFSLVPARVALPIPRPFDAQLTWAEMTYLRWGDEIGRETPRASSVVVAEKLD